VVSADHYSVLKRLFPKPVVKRPDVHWIVPGVHKIAGMNQDVTIGKAFNSIVKTMGVGNYDKTQF